MPIEIPTDLTPELVPLSWLIGEWEGRGRLGSGDEDSEHFFQHVSFTHNGLPYLQYRAESWLTDDDGTRLRPLTVETGFWALEREQLDADVGPGLVPADIVPALKSADEVEALRNKDGGSTSRCPSRIPAASRSCTTGRSRDRRSSSPRTW